jgi:MFS family permease
VHERPGEAVGDPADRQAGRVHARPLRSLLGLPSFRRFLLAQALSALVNGTLRFVLVWITLDLTDWTPAVGLVGMALGLSGLVVAVPAGAWSDRVDRRLMFVRLSGVTAAVLASATVTIAAGVGGVALLAVHAAILGGLLAAVAPGVQAMVPALVPTDRLMNGVALQMISMNVAMMLGAVSGGAAIALGGNAGGLGLLAACAGAAAFSMARVDLPVRAVSAAPARLRTQIAEGLRWSMGREPVRSLLAVMLAIGFLWGGVQLLLPDLAKERLGAGAFASSALFAPLGLGMLTTSLVLASRTAVARRGRLLALLFTGNAGPLVVVMALSRSYALTLALMVVWGIGGGVVMTMQRTLLQERIPDELMGRVMGLNTLGMLGSFPLAAGAAAVLTGAFGTSTALIVMGAATTAAAAAISLRRPVRTL